MEGVGAVGQIASEQDLEAFSRCVSRQYVMHTASSCTLESVDAAHGASSCSLAAMRTSYRSAAAAAAAAAAARQHPPFTTTTHRSPPASRDLTPALRGLVAEMALTGIIRYPWPLVRPLMQHLLETQLRRFDESSSVEVGGGPLKSLMSCCLPAARFAAHCNNNPEVGRHRIHPPPPLSFTRRRRRRRNKTTPTPQVGPARPVLIDGEALDALIEQLGSYLEGFEAAPWTAQRLAELLLEPGKQYTQLHKLVRQG